MSKAKLLFDLIMYVNSKRSFTAQEIADEFHVSVRTAHRYLMEISEMGVPLYTEQGRNGGYRILHNRILPPVLLDEHEALAIFFAFQSLRYYPSLPFDTDMDSASRKLYFSLPDDIKKKIDRLESVLSFWNPKRRVSSPFLKEIIEAALDHHVLIIEYRSKSNRKKREVVPIGLYANDGFWYMPAWDMEKDKVRLFRADRILSLENSKRTCELKMNLPDWLDGYTIHTPVRLYVKLTREGMRQCQSKPWFEPHIVSVDEDSGYIDTMIDYSEVEFLSSYFIQLGTEAQVIEPQEIVELIKKQASRLLDQYR
ncbi:helix-turn-helix transcriptional regulator [Paenibacillus residui]|uniref:Helix-turn-helix transcriptional regulator n=1 Tax=Paenibacillus residui TaxID=629724 RepID=A0ABW3DGF2_9BACL